jgi:hypothetical protein
MAVPSPRITLVPEDQTWVRRFAPLAKGAEMLEITTQEVEFTAEGTLLEVLRVVDVKDPVVTLLPRPVAIPLGVIECKRKEVIQRVD